MRYNDCMCTPSYYSKTGVGPCTVFPNGSSHNKLGSTILNDCST